MNKKDAPGKTPRAQRPRAAAPLGERGGGAPALNATDARGAREGRLGRVHDRLLDAAMLMHEGTPLDRALEQVFRRARDLGSHERSEISDRLYALARSRRRFQDLLDRGARALGKKLELLDPPLRVRLELLVLAAERGASLETIEEMDPYAFRRIPGLLARIVSGTVPEPKKRSAVEQLAVKRSLPDWLAERLYAAFGEARTDEIGVALSERAPLTLRVNTLRSTREEVRERIEREHGLKSTPTPLSPYGLILEKHASIQSWPMFEQGWIEVQDEGSQLIALALGARPGETVIDACAGAGGKTLALGASMNNTGRLIAVDRDEPKLLELGRRGRRAGLTNYEVIKSDFLVFPKNLEARADRVLVDAPCTGSGVYRRHPDARWRTTEADLQRLPNRQLSLLLRAADAVKPGGIIVYATCSILREENEDVVNLAAQEDPRLEPVPLAETLGEALAAAIGATHQARVGPGPAPDQPDGFFIAALRKRA